MTSEQARVFQKAPEVPIFTDPKIVATTCGWLESFGTKGPPISSGQKSNIPLKSYVKSLKKWATPKSSSICRWGCSLTKTIQRSWGNPHDELESLRRKSWPRRPCSANPHASLGLPFSFPPRNSMIQSVIQSESKVPRNDLE